MVETEKVEVNREGGGRAEFSRGRTGASKASEGKYYVEFLADTRDGVDVSMYK